MSFLVFLNKQRVYPWRNKKTGDRAVNFISFEQNVFINLIAFDVIMFKPVLKIAKGLPFFANFTSFIAFEPSGFFITIRRVTAF